jgi:predicted O-methyltransferase YrrM
MINPELEKYAEEHSSKESEFLYRLNRETHLKVLMPRMLSGAVQGKLLEMLSCMIRPKHILEIGTYTGYSAICLAKGLPADGVLHTIEKNPELETIAKKYFAEAEIEHQINYHLGDALEIIPQIKEVFDLVFLDADKENYLNYYHLIFDKVRSGGYILADNIFWSGKVLTTPEPNDKEALGIIEFNEFIQQDDRVENVILPLRDGLSLIRKK